MTKNDSSKIQCKICEKYFDKEEVNKTLYNWEECYLCKKCYDEEEAKEPPIPESKPDESLHRTINRNKWLMMRNRPELYFGK